MDPPETVGVTWAREKAVGVACDGDMGFGEGCFTSMVAKLADG